MMGRGLSKLQKTILAELESEIEQMNEAWRSLGYLDRDMEVDSIPRSSFVGKLHKKLPYPSPSISRAISRLESRGLIFFDEHIEKKRVEWIGVL